MEERQTFKQMVLEQLDGYPQAKEIKKKPWPKSHILDKNYFKMDQGLKCKCKIINLLKRSTGQNLWDLGLGSSHTWHQKYDP